MIVAGVPVPVVCDICGRRGPSAPTIDIARGLAVLRGWNTPGWGAGRNGPVADLCSGCRADARQAGVVGWRVG
jgi:hypothetical protein